MLRYAWRDLVRNPMRSAASLAGVVLASALMAGILLFIDGSSAVMTRRAIAPLTMDMQWVLSTPLGQPLTLSETADATGALAAGHQVTLTLHINNEGQDSEHELVVRAEPPPNTRYVPSSTFVAGQPAPDRDGDIPLAHGPARTGLNLGTVAPGAVIDVRFTVSVEAPVNADRLQLDATVSSREHPVPIFANQPSPLDIADLTARIRDLTGVAAADPLSMVDLPPGSVQTSAAVIDQPVRVFAFDESYQSHYPSVEVVDGGFTSDGVMISSEAARHLKVGPGDTMTISLPGSGSPLTTRISGVVDLSQATPLFSSRKASKFEDFLYVPDSLVMSRQMFQTKVIPAYRTATSQVGGQLRSYPLSEVDVLVDRSRLETSPADALNQTEAVANRIQEIGDGEGNLIDNISNTLAVARDDATTGRRMFLFLGVPAAVLAASLALYAANALSASQRRQNALLRVRGAHRKHLLRVLGARTLLFSLTGSVIGTAIGFSSMIVILGGRDLFAAPPGALAASVVMSVAVGTGVTSLALYLAGRRSLKREIAGQTGDLDPHHSPGWRRWGVDIGVVAAAFTAGAIALRLGAFDTQSTNVSIGRSTVLPSYLLLAPIVAWVGGALLAARIAETAMGHLPRPAARAYGGVVGGTLVRSIRRRAGTIGVGAAGVALIVALGVNLVVFASTYQAAKNTDARFALGSDVRFTPSVLRSEPFGIGTADDLKVDGIRRVTPVVYGRESAVLIGRFDQNVQDLAAVDPAGLAEVAPLPDSMFVDGTAAAELEALGENGEGVLISSEAADNLSISPGDQVHILLERGTDHQATAVFDVIGRFERFPGFADGVDLIVNLSRYENETGVDTPSFFMAATNDGSPDLAPHTITQLEATFGTPLPFTIESTSTVVLKDQSSLTATNIGGLVSLDTVYTRLMAATLIAVFVFALIMGRRREYAILVARGTDVNTIGLLIFGEVLAVAVAGATAGWGLGVGMAWLFVHVLRPLFILEPTLTIDTPGLLALGLVPAAAAAIATTVAVVASRGFSHQLLRDG